MIERVIREVLVPRYRLDDAQHLSVLAALKSRHDAGTLPANFRQHREVYAEIMVREVAGQELAEWTLARLRDIDVRVDDRPNGDLADFYCRMAGMQTPPGGGGD